MVAELFGRTVARGHGSDTTAESDAARTRPAGGTTAADAAGAAAITANDGSKSPAASAAADPSAQGALQTVGIERQSQQQPLNMRRLINVRGEDQWQNWSWKIQTAVSGMNGDPAEILNAAEKYGVRSAEEILKDNEFVGENREKCLKTSKEM